jgi:hypothetical protein
MLKSTAVTGVTIPYYLLSQFFVENLSSGSNSSCGSCPAAVDRLGEEWEKKLLAVEGPGQQQPQKAVVLLTQATLMENDLEAL